LHNYVRYVDLKACITRLPENGYGANVTTWPIRLQTPPDRLQSIQIDSFISRKEHFNAESKYWNEIIESYVRSLHWKKIQLRNVMDMRAGFGGYRLYLMPHSCIRICATHFSSLMVYKLALTDLRRH
jgi:hypothetical protein